MIEWAFKINSAFWILSPGAFCIGQALGVWDFKYDVAVFIGLMFMMGVSAFLNYKPSDKKAD